MVKNTTGGTKTKGLARKHQSSSGDAKLRLPANELELVACVTKMLGNGMCEIHTNKDVRLIGHIRNKFRGRNKRTNMISSSMIVLIGLREWENPSKNCDILTTYDDSQVMQLKNMPNIQMDNVIRRSQELSFAGEKVHANEFEFASNIDDDYEEEKGTTQNTMKKSETFTIEGIGEIDMDDI
jgi:initiation factor 1A